jgi:hypothetical protein
LRFADVPCQLLATPFDDPVVEDFDEVLLLRQAQAVGGLEQIGEWRLGGYRWFSSRLMVSPAGETVNLNFLRSWLSRIEMLGLELA